MTDKKEDLTPACRERGRKKCRGEVASPKGRVGEPSPYEKTVIARP
jgi:hypothetical protein